MGSAPLTALPARSRKDRGRIARAPASSRKGPCAGVDTLYPSRRDRPVAKPQRRPGEPVQLSILLLATDRASTEALTAALSQPGHGVTVVSDPVELFSTVQGHSLVIIDQVPAGYTVAGVIAELRRDEATSQLPVLAVAQADDLEERIGLLEAGADDVITKPFDQAELEARVEALSLRFQRSRERVPVVSATAIGDPRGRRIVAVFSPKGGVGTTTIATNLALVAAERQPGAVLLVDLDLSFGQVASHLNLQPKQSLVELARDEAALREVDLFRTYTVHHPGGIQVLAAPPAPGFAPLITAEHVELTLERALEAYDTVVVDAGATLDDRMLAIFGRSDTVVVPGAAGDPGPQRGPSPHRPALRDRRDGVDDDVRPQQRVRARPAQAIRHRGRARGADHRGAALRLDQLPEGRQRGQSRRPECAEVGGGGSAPGARRHRARPGPDDALHGWHGSVRPEGEARPVRPASLSGRRSG